MYQHCANELIKK